MFVAVRVEHVTPQEPQGQPEWQPDVLPGYWQQTIALGPDPDGEGDLVATVARRGQPGQVAQAVLVIHGYTDYFFHTELADQFAARGFAFYAIDLHKCGRSRRPGQTPHFTTDLASYYDELRRALHLIAADTGGARVCLYGHSAGGLIATLFSDQLRRDNSLGTHRVTGLILNSPFFDLHGPAVLRSAPVSGTLRALARFRKLTVIRQPTEGGYGTSLHRDHGGEFDYNLDWKPLGGFPVTVGWISAIRQGQRQLHRGLDVGVPNLILRSDHTVAETTTPVGMERGDAVLDVRQIARWAGCVGNRSTIVPVTDAKHDVFLSLPAPRAVAFAELNHWLDSYLRSASPTTQHEQA
ncbi:alpha/beta hydrolase [Mycolicibacterium aubagnense]|uniref:alpha/beta hydrolase n=1 Tax=Mycolicibacterium aubagnense TaxID=319707 RepID=UPI0010FF0886|nr:alpha/beta hydrolase [Mycolicibacterium aubagnense]TLH65480.1 alpha/beta hydrolase [Mycolicibacterium aubagnense]WGI30958.1 alpha/beta hydrolase [Mycolicibacterium aubagnense]